MQRHCCLFLCDASDTRFASLCRHSQSWWDPAGDFAILQRFNPVRVKYILETAVPPVRGDVLVGAALPMAGLSVIDIGCGGGLLSESLARLGARVTGVDAVADNIGVAKAHAAHDPLLAERLDYDHSTAEEYVAQGATYDLVVASEVIEHVSDRRVFLESCRRLMKPVSVPSYSRVYFALTKF